VITTTKALSGRATARPGRRSLIALLAVGGGGCAIAGAFLPWLSVYAGLDSYSGVAGTNGRLLAAGGTAAVLLGLVYRLRPAAAVRYSIGGLGFLLTLFSTYLLAQLLSIYKQLHGVFLPALGPGVFLATGGALLIFSTFFVATEPPLREVKQERTGIEPATAALVALSAAAGVVHLSVASDHFAEYLLFGLFFVGVGVAQVVWAALVAVAGPVYRLLMLAVGNALVVALWIASRTTGVPLGPSSGHPEQIGYADVVTTVFEVATVALAVALLSRRRAALLHHSPVLWSVPLLIAPPAALAVLSAVGAIGFLPASG
jgi:hypothetical protein